MKEGWICPRCNRVNAPFMPYCDCYKNISIANKASATRAWNTRTPKERGGEK